MNLSRKTLGVFQIVIASLGFAFLGTFSRLAREEGLSTGTLLTFRFSLATALLFIYFLLSNPLRLKLTRKDILISLALGLFGYTIFSTLYFSAMQSLSLALAALLLYTYPFWILVLRIFQGRRPPRNEAALLAAALVGMGLLLWGPMQMTSTLGILSGIGSAISYSIFILASEKYQQKVPALAASWYVMLAASIGLWAIHSPLSHSVTELSQQAWLILLGISVVSTIFPLVLVLLSLQKIESSTVSLLSLTEPLAAIFLSSFLFSENLSSLQLIGAAIVMIALGLKTKLDPFPS